MNKLKFKKNISVINELRFNERKVISEQRHHVEQTQKVFVVVK